jgi:hypothetical protein
MTTSRTVATLCAMILAATTAPATTRAQSAQALSIQVSGLYAALFGEAYESFQAGPGFEAQLRYTTTTGWSFGAGFQRTSHEIDFGDDEVNSFDQDVSLAGPFFEPRYTFVVGAGTTAFPYVSGRLSLLQQKVSLTDDAVGLDVSGSASGLNANVGGGVLIRMSSRVNLDLGLTYGYTNFQDFTIRDRTTGESFTGPSGSGTNVVARVGLAIGLR